MTLDNFAHRYLGGLSARRGRGLAAAATTHALTALVTTTFQETTAEFSRGWRDPRRLAVWLLFAVGFVVLDRLSAFFLPGVVALTPWDLAGGLAFGFLMLEGPGAAVLVSLVDFADDFLAPGQHSPLPSLALAALATGASYGMATAWLRARGVRRLEGQRDLVQFAAAAALASLAHVCADLTLLGRWSLVADRTWAGALSSAWSGAFVGILIVAPLFLLRWREQALSTRARLEAAAMAGVLGAMIVFSFHGAPGDRFRFFYLLFLPQTWVAVRFGVTGAALGNLLLQIGLTTYFVAGLGPRDMAFDYQFRFLALVSTILFLGSAVSERRSMEAALRQRQEELARVSRLTLAGEMAAALAHQLNQPLMAAMAFTRSAQRLLRHGGHARNDAASEAMDEAVHQADRAASILRSLRDFIGRSSPVQTAVALEPMLREAVELMEDECGRRGAKIALFVEHGMPLVVADPVQIQQVLINLLRNALDALEGTRRRQVAIRAHRLADQKVEVEIRDTGPGVPAEVVGGLFEPFTSGKPGGMGLGLTVCRSLVEAQGGRLWLAENQPGGCSFRFTLPLAPPGRPA